MLKTKPIKLFYFIAPVLGVIIGLLILPIEGKEEKDFVSPGLNNQKNTNTQVSTTNSKSSKTVKQQIITAQTLLSQAISLSKQKDTANNDRIVSLVNEALDSVNQAIGLAPNDPLPYAQRAKIYQTIEKYMPEARKQAIANLQKAINLDPQNANYCQELAQLFLEDDLKSAVYYLEKAVNINPTDPNLIRSLAQTQVKAGHIQRARDNYQNLIGLLTDPVSQEEVKEEITSLNTLLAETAKTQQLTQQISPTQQTTELTLPNNPPKLQAHHLANNTFIAAPDQKDSGENQEELNSNALSGLATISQGEKEISICNNNLSPDTQVYLTPETKTNQILFVKNKSPYNPETDQCANFIAATAKPAQKDLTFRWLIIETE